MNESLGNKKSSKRRDEDGDGVNSNTEPLEEPEVDKADQISKEANLNLCSSGEEEDGEAQLAPESTGSALNSVRGRRGLK